MDQDRIVGRYRILRELGRGGGGTVWLCQDESLGREVALKRVEPAAGDDAGETVRGLREARTAAALSHEGIVAVYDLFEHDGRAWIVMEYVPGQSLADLTREGARLEPDLVARLGAQVAAAVAAAHRAGIVHRDIKPGNVLVTRDWRAKLTDFGIARAQHDEALTRTGLVSGTAAYFSPELAEGADAGPASDVWALGATLYAAVEGRAPHPVRANPLAALRDIATGPPLPPDHAGPLEAVLAGMMQRDPAGRWSAEHSVSALRTVADGSSVTGPPAPWLAAASAGGADATQAVPRADPRDLPRATGVGSAAAHAGQQDRARAAVGPSREGGRGGGAATA
ncbi:MAG: serine/threonine protein kinase, partial [Actinomycetota bacterium]|nr:serine/threonine protein kinase [Actinomycetota bacterium]